MLKPFPLEVLNPLIDEMRARKQFRLVVTVAKKGDPDWELIPEWDNESMDLRKDQTDIRDLTQLTWGQFLSYVGKQPQEQAA